MKIPDFITQLNHKFAVNQMVCSELFPFIVRILGQQLRSLLTLHAPVHQNLRAISEIFALIKAFLYPSTPRKQMHVTKKYNCLVGKCYSKKNSSLKDFCKQLLTNKTTSQLTNSIWILTPSGEFIWTCSRKMSVCSTGSSLICNMKMTKL